MLLSLLEQSVVFAYYSLSSANKTEKTTSELTLSRALRENTRRSILFILWGVHYGIRSGATNRFNKRMSSQSPDATFINVFV